MRFLLVLACACSSSAPPAKALVHDDARPTAHADATAATSAAATGVPATKPRWLAGDLHMHCAPPDDPSDVAMGVAEIAQRARDAKLDFVVLTPHVWPARRGARFDEQWHQMHEAAHAVKAPVVIPGVEWTTGAGHFTIAGVDFAQLGADVLASASAKGAFVSVNHPFAVPTKLPVIRASHFDMSYRAWTAGSPPEPINGVEVFNLPLALANVLARPGGQTGEERAWQTADRLARTEHKKLTAVGGTDNHQLTVLATTWVLALDATEDAILEGLHTGATCIGGPEAGSFRARSDDGSWVPIGGTIAAADTATLAWDGAARLFVDGADAGIHTGGYVHATLGVPHTYRIVAGPSRSGFIYANL